MINHSILAGVSEEQLQLFNHKDTGIDRNVDYHRYLKSRLVTVITGVRRCGKSTLLTQFGKRLKNFYYLNLDDERLISFTVDDFSKWIDICQTRFSSRNVLLDEVQNVYQWERFVRRISDMGYKIFLTGSNSSLLDSELSTHLTGRYLTLELYPFSFAEVLKFSKINSVKPVHLIPALSTYLKEGGFPEYYHNKDPEILKRVYEDILYRDIMVRNQIRNVKQFRELARFIISNISKEFSYNSACKILGFKSHTSVKNAITFMQDAYLLFELYKFDYSLKKQYVSNKKMYSIDTGLRNAVSFSVFEDKGQQLENLVFIELKRRYQEIFYYKGRGECDFIIRDKGKITLAIQVCYNLAIAGNREFEGLIEASESSNMKDLTVITMEEDAQTTYKGKKIKIIPVWQWLRSHASP